MGIIEDITSELSKFGFAKVNENDDYIVWETDKENNKPYRVVNLHKNTGKCILSDTPFSNESILDTLPITNIYELIKLLRIHSVIELCESTNYKVLDLIVDILKEIDYHLSREAINGLNNG